MTAAAAAVAWLAVRPARAQAYPERAVRVIVPYPAGAGTDIAIRAVAQRVADAWGQPVIVENRPGAGATIGMEAVAKAAPDGYTVGVGDIGPLAVNPGLYRKLPYDPARDFAPVIEIGRFPFMLVAHPSLGVSTVSELVALAKSRPGQLNYASGGNGTASHLAMELMKRQTGIDVVHIPYKGQPPALTDVLAGTTQLMFLNLLSGLAHVRSGKLRALAVGAAQRLSALPAVPTLAEAGVVGYEFDVWFGIVAPAGTPEPVIARLNAEFRRALALPDLRDRLRNEGGMEASGGSPAEFAALVSREQDRWRTVVREAGLRID